MNFWKIKAISNNIGEIVIYGEIRNEKWGDNDVAPLEFKKQLDALGDVAEIKIYINSPGGSVFAGHAIYNMLKRHPANKIVYIDGIAASAASIIAMVGNKVIMPKNSLMMIHKPWTCVIGNVDEIMKQVEVLNRMELGFVQIYKEKTGLDEQVISDMLTAERWFSAAEAIEYKFADELDSENVVAASISGKEFNINGLKTDTNAFKNFPTLNFKSVIDMEDKPIVTKSKAVTADDINNFIKETERKWQV